MESERKDSRPNRCEGQGVVLNRQTRNQKLEV